MCLHMACFTDDGVWCKSEAPVLRKRDGYLLTTPYCAYTDYQSDHTDDYTYFIGEEVTSFDTLPEGFQKLTIPHQHYVKFTTKPAPMPEVIVNAWEKIWEMSPKELGGKR